MDDRIRLQLQELQHRQVTELDESMKQMECRAKLKRENEAVGWSTNERKQIHDLELPTGRLGQLRYC